MADCPTRDQPAPQRPLTLLAIAPSAYLPALLYSVGTGAVAPVVALVGLRLGASTGQAGSLLGLLALGQILADVPASALAARIGERRAMLAASVVAVGLYTCGLLAGSLWTLAVALTALGMTNAVFLLARQAYLTEVAPPHLRARAMATLGGANRIGLLVGPFVGAAGIHVWGERAAFGVAMAAAVLTGVLLVVVPDLPAQESAGRHGGAARGVGRAHLRLFLTLGSAIVLVGIVRGSRTTVLPLWAEHLRISPASTSLIFGIAAAVEVVLFYPAGQVMDRFGRLAVAVPAMVVLGTSLLLLPLTSRPGTLTAVAVAMGFGNGIGSGIMLTLSADTAPPSGRARFLGIWRVLGDSGSAAGPMLVSVLATVWELSVGIVGVGVIGLLSAASLVAWVPRYSPFATRRAVRRSGPAPG